MLLSHHPPIYDRHLRLPHLDLKLVFHKRFFSRAKRHFFRYIITSCTPVETMPPWKIPQCQSVGNWLCFHKSFPWRSTTKYNLGILSRYIFHGNVWCFSHLILMISPPSAPPFLLEQCWFRWCKFPMGEVSITTLYWEGGWKGDNINIEKSTKLVPQL
jgi:hypothetical protein